MLSFWELQRVEGETIAQAEEGAVNQRTKQQMLPPWLLARGPDFSFLSSFIRAEVYSADVQSLRLSARKALSDA